jgi:purine nucleosidase
MSRMTLEQVVIDTDPGIDDAVALLLALAEPERLNIAGITTVAGNVPLALATTNALRIVELACRADVAVHAGASAPLMRALRTAVDVHGADGLAGAGLPAPSLQAAAPGAVQWLVDTLTAAAPQSIVLCALGPLTNLALAFAQAPELVSRVARIVLMGGARDLGNVTPAAEFNFHVDPEAAAMVFRLGIPIVMHGLHATHQVIATPQRVARIAALGTPAARAIAGMLGRPPRAGTVERLGMSGHALHDPCVIAWLLWPELFSGRDCHVEIETCGASTLGRSTIDWWDSLGRPANAHVIDRIDAGGLFERLTASLVRLR